MLLRKIHSTLIGEYDGDILAPWVQHRQLNGRETYRAGYVDQTKKLQRGRAAYIHTYIHTLGLTSWQCYGQKPRFNYFHQPWLIVMADYFVRWFQINENDINIEKYIISCSKQGAQFLLSINTRQTMPCNNILKQYHTRGITVILNIIPVWCGRSHETACQEVKINWVVGKFVGCKRLPMTVSQPWWYSV